MGIDRRIKFMLVRVFEDKGSQEFLSRTFLRRKREFIHIERLANFDKLPGSGFKIICFPVRIKGTGAAWSRVVALFEQ
jgi:cyclase